MTASPPTTPSVRRRLLAAIDARLRAVNGVGGVFDAALLTDTLLAESLARGQHIVEYIAGDDEPLGGPGGGGAGGGQPLTVEGWSFDTAILCHVAVPPPPEDPAEQPPTRTPSDLAAELCADLYRAFMASDALRTFALDDGGTLALDTEWLGGGGVFVAVETGTVCFACTFRVSYRHSVGSPEVPR